MRQRGTFDVESGEVAIRVQLFNAGVLVVERPAIMSVRDDTGVTILISRDCRGVECPGAGDPGDLACLGGVCGDPRCTDETPEFCNINECETGADCLVPADCASATCELGTCFFATRPGVCAADEVCIPESGCETAITLADGGTVDAGAGDAGVLDAGAGDVGIPEGFLPEGCLERTVPTLAMEVLEEVSRPRLITSPPGDVTRLFVMRSTGVISIIENGTLLEEPFLEIAEISTTSTQEGGNAMAFHPDYATNGRFFVYYTSRSPRHDILAEYQRSEDPNVAEPAEVRRLVDIEDRYSIHNGGMLEFAPDGLLYLGLGDEGTGNDREGHGQNRQTLHGSVLRLDVDAAGAEFAAAGNPFRSPAGLPQIWATGLSNPWRGSFDPVDEVFIFGDESSSAQEINVLDMTPGTNFGWSAYAAGNVRDEDQLPIDTHTRPIYSYSRSVDGILPGANDQIVGGYVYRGADIEGLQGFYLFGDSASMRIAAFNYCGGVATNLQLVEGVSFAGSLDKLISFGRDGRGELYVLSIDGTIRRLVAAD